MIFERIKDLAEKQHFSNLQEVAEKAGYGKNLIYSWKRKKPNSDSLKAVAKVLMKNARKSPYFNAGMDRAKLT